MNDKTIKALKRDFRQLSDAHLPYHWLESLLLFVLNQDKAFLITNDDYVLSEEEYQAVHQGLTQLQNHTPLAHLIGRQGFFGHEFVVNEHTLIPRADTEILVETVLAFVRENRLDNARILDLGTGTGCIGISLAKALPNSRVLLSDKSHHALAVAKDNAMHLRANNCQCHHGSWYEGIHGRFDVIVSNPPYIAKDDEHLRHLGAEPLMALVADDEGLSDIKMIIVGALTHLHHGGLLAIEHGYDQGVSVQSLFCQANFKEIRTIKDYGGNDRVTMGIYEG